MNHKIGDIPKHLYIQVDSEFTHEKPCGFVPAVWFGLVSEPGRMWGLNVMFEWGGIYREVPPHAIAFSEFCDPRWDEDDAQLWDCYGTGWWAHEYTYLRGLRCRAKVKNLILPGEYLFTVAPIGDAFSNAPEQSKEFMFIRLDNNRLTVQPTNRVVFEDRSFTEDMEIPRLKLADRVWSCEG